MKRFLPLFIFLSFLICYLEWSGGNSGFIFQLEYDLLTEGIHKTSIIHPLILLPLAGQVLLVVALFYPKRKLILAAILMLSALAVMILIVGLLTINVKIILSTLPFLALSVFYIVKFKKDRRVRLDM